MANKTETAAAINQALDLNLSPDDYSAKQLAELAQLTDDRAAFSAKLEAFDEARAAAIEAAAEASAEAAAKAAEARAEKPAVPTVTVRVNAKIAAYGGAFTDGGSGKTIGKDPVEVPHTAFVKARVRSGEIIVVEED